MKKLLFSLMFIFTATMLNIEMVHAVGVGISPSQINIEYLKPGLTISRNIMISRDNTEAQMTFSVTTDNSESSGWIKVLPQSTIVMAKGESQKEFSITITVPKNAEFKKYSSNIYVVEKNAEAAEGVTIQTGLVMNLSLVITDKDKIDLKVISAKITESYYASDIKFSIVFKNDGNVATTAGRLQLDIFGIDGKIASTFETDINDSVDPLSTETKEIVLSGTNLIVGDYRGKLKIYDLNDNEIFNYDVSFKVDTAPVKSVDTVSTIPIIAIISLVVGAILIIIAATHLLKRRKK